MLLYWSIGREILDLQKALGWGDDVLGRISEDLRTDTGGARGFSRRNLFYMRRFAALWPGPEKVQPLAAHHWAGTHHQALLDAFADDPNATNGMPPRSASTGGRGVISRAKPDAAIDEQLNGQPPEAPLPLRREAEPLP